MQTSMFLTAAFVSVVFNLNLLQLLWRFSVSVCVCVWTGTAPNAAKCTRLQRETLLICFIIGTRPRASIPARRMSLDGFLLERFLSEALFVNSQPT